MSELDDLGARFKAINDELEELKPKLKAAMLAERWNEDGTPKTTQSEIQRRSGYKTIQQVRVILGEAKLAANQ